MEAGLTPDVGASHRDPMLESMMANKQSSRGRKQDRVRVAAGQKHEVQYEAKKTGKSGSQVKRAVKKVGNSRKRVERALNGVRV